MKDDFLTPSKEPNLFDTEDVTRMRRYQTELVMLLNTYNRDTTRTTILLFEEIQRTERWLKTKDFLTKL